MGFLSSLLEQPFILSYVLMISTLVALVIFEYQKRAKYFTKHNRGKAVIPGPMQIPVLGNLYQLIEPSLLTLPMKYLQFYRRWSWLGVGRLWLWDILAVFPFRPEYLETLLGDVKKVQKAKEYRQVLGSSPLGGGLISQMDDNIWRIHRKIITPTFHFNVLKTYIPVFHEESLILLNKMEKEFTQDDGKVVVPNVNPLITLSTFNMILRNAFGVNIHAQKNEGHSFVSAMYEATEIIQTRLSYPWLLWDLLFSLLGYKKRQEESTRTCHEFTESVIRQKRSEYRRKQQQREGRDSQLVSGLNTYANTDTSKENCPMEFDNRLGHANDEIRDEMNNYIAEPKQVTQETNVSCHKSFLELIIENEESEEDKMSDQDIRDNMITIMFAGQDTTATTNCLTLLMLALHPDIQTQTLKEIDDVFGGPSADDGHVPTYAEIMQLQCLDRVIKETTRLYPAAPVMGRGMTHDTPVGPYVLPKNTSVVIFTFGLHRDPEIHERADEFWPERFLPHNACRMHNFSFIPFGAGSRNCIGQKYAMLQMKIMMSTVLRRYHVATDETIRSVRDVDKLITIKMTLGVDRCPVVFTRRRAE
ncbi:hypothetical protein M8J76_009087 [Diaphorina citri]|nr:hypothetical protein M8J76_009087 [Diaphorina citri]